MWVIKKNSFEKEVYLLLFLPESISRKVVEGNWYFRLTISISLLILSSTISIGQSILSSIISIGQLIFSSKIWIWQLILSSKIWIWQLILSSTISMTYWTEHIRSYWIDICPIYKILGVTYLELIFYTLGTTIFIITFITKTNMHKKYIIDSYS